MTWTPIVVSLMGLLGTSVGVVGTVAVARWKRIGDERLAALAEAKAEAEQKASPYEALATRVVTLESSDAAKHTQIVGLTAQVMTIEATSESRRLLLSRAAVRHAGVVAHVDTVEGWIEGQTPGADYPRLDPEFRLPVVVQ